MMPDEPTPEDLLRTAWHILRRFADIIAERDGLAWDDPTNPIIFRIGDTGIQATRLSALLVGRQQTERGH